MSAILERADRQLRAVSSTAALDLAVMPLSVDLAALKDMNLPSAPPHHQQPRLLTASSSMGHVTAREAYRRPLNSSRRVTPRAPLLPVPVEASRSPGEDADSTDTSYSPATGLAVGNNGAMEVVLGQSVTADTDDSQRILVLSNGPQLACAPDGSAASGQGQCAAAGASLVVASALPFQVSGTGAAEQLLPPLVVHASIKAPQLATSPLAPKVRYDLRCMYVAATACMWHAMAARVCGRAVLKCALADERFGGRSKQNLFECHFVA